MPFYISLTIFRVCSLSLVLEVLGVYALILYAILFIVLIWIGSVLAVRRYSKKFCNVWEYWRLERTVLSMALRSTVTTVRSKYQMEMVFQTFWFVVNLLLVAIINLLVRLKEDNIILPYVMEKKIFEDIFAFNVLLFTICSSGCLSLLLFFYQIKKEDEDTMYDLGITKYVTQRWMMSQKQQVQKI